MCPAYGSALAAGLDGVSGARPFHFAALWARDKAGLALAYSFTFAFHRFDALTNLL
jgi:hypothetical protein